MPVIPAPGRQAGGFQIPDWPGLHSETGSKHWKTKEREKGRPLATRPDKLTSISRAYKPERDNQIL